MLTWALKPLARRPLEAGDVTRAHLAAPQVLESWQARTARHGQSAFLGPALGAVVPLIGCFVLGWTPGVVWLALAADVVTLWLCDAVKWMLARDRVRAERAQHDQAGDVLAVIDALRTPRLPRRRDRLESPLKPQWLLSSLPSSLLAPSERPAGVAAIVFGVLVFWVVIAATLPHLVPWLACAAALRLLVCVIRTRRARRDPGSRPELLPEAGVPTLVLCLALYGSFLILTKFDPDPALIGSDDLAALILGLHLVIAIAVGMLGWRRIRGATTALRRFAAQDRVSLTQRVRQING